MRDSNQSKQEKEQLEKLLDQARNAKYSAEDEFQRAKVTLNLMGGYSQADVDVLAFDFLKKAEEYDALLSQLGEDEEEALKDLKKENTRRDQSEIIDCLDRCRQLILSTHRRDVQFNRTFIPVFILNSFLFLHPKCGEAIL